MAGEPGGAGLHGSAKFAGPGASRFETARQSNGELISAVAASDSGRGEDPGDGGADQADGIGAGEVAEGVVHRFEAIRIHDDESHRPAVLDGGGEHQAQSFLESAKIQQTGQIVRSGQFGQPAGVASQLAATKTTGEEDRALEQIGLPVAHGGGRWIGEVVENDGGCGDEEGEAGAEADGGEDDGYVVEVLDRRFPADEIEARDRGEAEEDGAKRGAIGDGVGPGEDARRGGGTTHQLHEVGVRPGYLGPV